MRNRSKVFFFVLLVVCRPLIGSPSMGSGISLPAAEHCLVSPGGESREIEIRELGPEDAPFLQELNEEELTALRQAVENHWYYSWKSRIEKVIVAIALPLVALPAAAVWAAVRCEGAGPVIYTQNRPGRNGIPFRILKFRTMKPDSDKASHFTRKNDERVTRLGRFIRRIHLDELPQLWNVLRGEMSLVGPRPMSEKIYDELKKSYPQLDFRLMIPPGVTGLAQIELPYCATLLAERDKILLDKKYFQNFSLRQDIILLFRTVLAVVFGHGSH